MADFEVKKKPEFSSTARKLETTDRAHADLFNGLYQKMFDNDNYLKQNVESKAEKDGGDIANTKVSEFVAETEQFPVPVPGEAPKTLWGKMKKFVEDFKAWCTGVCLIGHIVNNCTSTASNMPLAAAQGNVLMDLYTQLYSDLQTNKKQISIDITSLQKVHFYKVNTSGYDYYVMVMYTDISKSEGISIDFDPLQREIRFYMVSNNVGKFICSFTPREIPT